MIFIAGPKGQQKIKDLEVLTDLADTLYILFVKDKKI